MPQRHAAKITHRTRFMPHQITWVSVDIIHLPVQIERKQRNTGLLFRESKTINVYVCAKYLTNVLPMRRKSNQCGNIVFEPVVSYAQFDVGKCGVFQEFRDRSRSVLS